jgi:hypothetical protein
LIIHSKKCTQQNVSAEAANSAAPAELYVID